MSTCLPESVPAIPEQRLAYGNERDLEGEWAGTGNRCASPGPHPSAPTGRRGQWATPEVLWPYLLRPRPDPMGKGAKKVSGMAKIEGEIIIDRPVDVVFDYVADQSNEPQYNPQMVRAQKITPGPVSEGTQFRSAVASRGRTTEMLIEVTKYDRPTLLSSTTTMQQADISYTLSFEPAAGGTRMQWSAQVRPKGAFRLLGPMITWMGMRQEQRIWTSLKRHIETAPTGTKS